MHTTKRHSKPSRRPRKPTRPLTDALRRDVAREVTAYLIHRLFSNRSQPLNTGQTDATILSILAGLGIVPERPTVSLIDQILLGYGGTTLAHLKQRGSTCCFTHVSGLSVFDDLVRTQQVATVQTPECFDEHGDPVQPSTRIIDGMALPEMAFRLIRFHGELHALFFTLYSADRLWEVKAYGPAAISLLTDLDRRVQEWLVARYRGTIVDTALRPMDLRRWAREDLVYPAALGAKVDRLRRTLQNWFASAEVHQWSVLLVGGPGTGKTTIGGLLAAERPEGCTFVYGPAAELQDARLISAAFERAAMLAPSVLHIDDVDLIARSRDEDGGNAGLTHALMEHLDGLRSQAKVFVILTTNDPTVIDPAILQRSGRVQDKIVFEGFGECMEQIFRRISDQAHLTMPDDVIGDAIARTRALVNDFTPDDARVVCRRLCIEHGDRAVVTAEMLSDAIGATHEATYGTACNRSFLRKPTRRSGWNGATASADR